jgi:hypothetical protein
LAQLVGIWNNISGVTPVTRFTDRQTAVRRIWNALHPETATGGKANRSDKGTATSANRKPQRGRKPLARPASKKALVIEMLRQSKGATLKQIMDATGWQAHSVRGFISGSLGKKSALKVTSSKRSDGERVYQLSRT